MTECNLWKVFGYVSILYFFYSMFGMLMSFLLVGSLVHFTGGVKDIAFAKRIIARDFYWAFVFATKFIPALKKIKSKTPNQLLQETTEKYPNKMALVDAESGKSLTFNQIQIFINKVGHVFKKSGFNPGDKIALFLGNELEYVPIWLGLNRISVQVGLINYNLQGKSLEHCLTVVDFKAVLCGPRLVKVLENIGFHEKSGVEIFVYGDESFEGDYKDLKGMIKDQQDCNPTGDDILGPKGIPLFIYTSGSTGKPKAVRVTNEKILGAFISNDVLTNTPNDVVYCALPFYHGAGGVGGVSPMIYNGCTTIIRKKFSASKFIFDCVKHDVTWVVYIGELWKYILSQPHRDIDRQHKIRIAVGNGLRLTIFGAVKERFDIERIVELYGATDGNAVMINLDGVPGSVGFYYFLFPFLNQNCLVKADVETGEVIRDDNGHAILCKPGEIGLIVGLIRHDKGYDGYVNNAKETEKKIIRNLFKDGDSAVHSGDLLVMDEFRNVFFVDRIGDTFRWRGENVATTEVENIMSSVISSAEDVVVYPVPIPGEGGNAGMAFIREKESQQFSIEGVAKSLLEELPKYAIPMFIRVGRNLDQTGTFKYQKSSLKKQKYDLNSCNKDDVVYVYDVTKKNYTILDSELQEKIENEKMRF